MDSVRCFCASTSISFVRSMCVCVCLQKMRITFCLRYFVFCLLSLVYALLWCRKETTQMRDTSCVFPILCTSLSLYYISISIYSLFWFFFSSRHCRIFCDDNRCKCLCFCVFYKFATHENQTKHVNFQ